MIGKHAVVALLVGFAFLMTGGVPAPAEASRNLAGRQDQTGQDVAPTSEEETGEQEAKPTAITGRIVTSDGQPVTGATVQVFPPSGGGRGVNRTAKTDLEGKFTIPDLPPGAYRLSARAPGYVASDADEPGAPRTFYWPGATVNLTLVKGGVITGTVTSTATGAPIIAMPVRLVRAGKPQPGGGGQLGENVITDDRGIYRIYGIPKGSYYVVAGGQSSGFFGLNQGFPYEGEVRTFYPSATMDTAVAVNVNSGDEITSIDIAHRGTRGYAVSGTINSPVQTTNGAVSLVLYRTADGAAESSGFVLGGGDAAKFALYGIADGKFELVAQAWGQTGLAAVSDPIAVTVRGADVTGLNLTLVAVGKVEGTVTLEKVPPATRPATFKPDGNWNVDESVLQLRRDDPKQADRAVDLLDSGNRSLAPESSGAFSFPAVRPGPYRLLVESPTDDWYLRTVERSTGEQAKGTDLTRSAFAVQPGQAVAGIRIVLSEGAASVSGRVSPAREGQAIQAGARVMLVPAEPADAENPLRYFDAKPDRSGDFTIKHVPPGKYFVVASTFDAEPANPPFWDKATRTRMRTAAVSLKQEIVLGVSAREKDVSVKLDARPVK